MLKRIALLVVLLLAMGTTAQEGPALSGAEGIRNFLRVNEKICTGGQPTLAQLAELKAGGLRAVLNLRRPTEKQTPRPGAEPVPYDAAAEAAEAGRLGLRYFNIAVDPDVPTDAQVDEFLKILADRENRPIFIHCGSASRVGAFWMIRRVLVDEWPLEEAEAEAKRIGLSNEKTRAFARDYLARRRQQQ